jgi:hypothetical protein
MRVGIGNLKLEIGNCKFRRWALFTFLATPLPQVDAYGHAGRSVVATPFNQVLTSEVKRAVQRHLGHNPSSAVGAKAIPQTGQSGGFRMIMISSV